MFIQCSDCDYKYIVNSADLKPDGRMVECANCNHRWFQEPLKGEDLLSSSVPKTSQEKPLETKQESQNNEPDLPPTEIKNLPSTVVREQKVSFIKDKGPKLENFDLKKIKDTDVNTFTKNLKPVYVLKNLIRCD